MASLEKARQRIEEGRCLLIAADITVSPKLIPNGIETRTAVEWLLE
jgi:hypothetical protein